MHPSTQLLSTPVNPKFSYIIPRLSSSDKIAQYYIEQLEWGVIGAISEQISENVSMHLYLTYTNETNSYLDSLVDTFIQCEPDRYRHLEYYKTRTYLKMVIHWYMMYLYMPVYEIIAVANKQNVLFQDGVFVAPYDLDTDSFVVSLYIAPWSKSNFFDYHPDEYHKQLWEMEE